MSPIRPKLKRRVSHVWLDPEHRAHEQYAEEPQADAQDEQQADAQDEWQADAQEAEAFEREGSLPVADSDAPETDAGSVTEHACAPTYPTPLDQPCERPYLFAGLRAEGISLIADTLDWDVLRGYGFNVTKASPKSLWNTLAVDSEVYYYLWVAVHKKLDVNLGRTTDHGKLCECFRKIVLQQFLAELGNALMEFVDGDHITFVDYRLHEDADAMERYALSLVRKFEGLGRDRSAIIVSVPATTQGIAAAARLGTAGIKVNLDLVSNVAHAALCAEARAYAITVPVAEMLAWHTTRTGTSLPYDEINGHPLFDDIQTITAYFRLREIRTLVMGGALRHENEACSIATFDAISFDSAQAERSKWYNTYPPAYTDDFSVEVVERAMAVKSARKTRGMEYDLDKELSAASVSMASAVVYMQLGENNVEMTWLDDVVDREITQRLEYHCTPPVSCTDADAEDGGAVKRKRESGDTPPRAHKSRRVGDVDQEVLDTIRECWEPVAQKDRARKERKARDLELKPGKPKKRWDHKQLWQWANECTEKQSQPANTEAEDVDPMDEVF